MPARGKIAVTGATGRVGRHIVDVLEERGHDVVGISRSQGVDVVTGERAGGGAGRGGDRGRRGYRPVARGGTGHRVLHGVRAESCKRSASAPACSGSSSVSIIGVDRFIGELPGRKAGSGTDVAGGPDPGPDLARGAVPRVRAGARQLGQTGRRQLPPEDAHAASRSSQRRRGARRPRHPARLRSRRNQRSTDPGDRRSRAGKPRRRRRGCSSPIAAIRSGSRVSATQPVGEGSSSRTVHYLPGPHATLAGPTFKEWLEAESAR